jgi:hypothetical protein
MVVALVIAFPKFGVPSPYSPGFSSLWLPVLVLYSVAFRGKAKVGWTIAIALAAVGAAWMIGVRPRYGSASLLGDLFSTLSGAFVATAKFVALTAPLAAVAWFVFRASSNRDNRRAIGVFWDLTNYWPRWFHPWAAPPYTEVAIHDFQKRIEHLLAEADVGNVVISAHSQGAVITMPVLAKLMSEQQPAARLKLMTYGCLIGQHYRILFPRFFTKEVVDDVQGWLDGRWRNLYRITDPLGHPIGLTGNSDIEAAWQVAGIDEVLSHSDYQYSPEYQGVLSTL